METVKMETMKISKFMKKHSEAGIVLAVLVFIAAFGLTACGSKGGDGSSVVSGRESDGGKENHGDKEGDGGGEEQTESKADPETEQIWKEPTLADGKAKLICRDGVYLCVAYYGPCSGASFANTDGKRIADFVGYGRPSHGWTIIQCKEFPEEYANEDVMLLVTDQTAERNADGTYQTGLFPFPETLTKEEAVEIGLDIVADHICMVSTDKPTYGWNNFTAPFVYVNYLDEYHGRPIEEIEGLMESFSFYAEDGTPLGECFEGYTMKCEPGIGTSICIYFYNDDTSGSSSALKEQNKAKCDELRALKPYIVYTAPDGTTQQFPFFKEK